MNPEISLEDIRKKFNQLGGEEDTADLPTFAIVNERAEQQILQINLTPASMVYARANRIYTNTSKLKTKKIKNKRLADFFRNLGNRQPIQMLINDTPALFIVGCKHHNKHGHILILDLGVYRQSLYYNWEYLIASRSEPQDKHKHPLGGDFRLLQYKQKIDNIFEALDMGQETVALQADSVIIEKNLAEDEQFCLYEKENIIAFSRSVKMQPLKGNIVKATGPGWLFFQTTTMVSSARKRTNSYARLIMVLALVMMVLETALAMML